MFQRNRLFVQSPVVFPALMFFLPGSSMRTQILLCFLLFFYLFTGYVYADSTQVAFKNTTITPKKDSSIPVGTVITWYSKRNPDTDWLECNGQLFDQTSYPKLYLFLGRSNHVPDFRTRFLRAGESTQIGIQGEDTIASHTSSIAAQTVSAKTSSLSSKNTQYRSVQNVQSVNNTISTADTEEILANASASATETLGYSTDIGSRGASLLTETTASYSTETRLTASLEDGTVSGVIGAHEANYVGASETVPKFAYVRYFIRAR